MKWIKVDGYRKLPIGEWLVYIPEDNIGKYHVALVYENITLVGGSFAFETRGSVTHYMELLERPE